ncbi:uncharacterized protein PGTG_01721 [Puccinia graminis f. sp. tritici CRL 75-36-700-3]|uniref:Uncharacterized protein n=1 Tax=Puccinia graminis f. sp. tritici (strain CRL 75-36-700-3 / race SCCL) TaxID=418459 RepID=E3JSV3_PUCGT|nr:uncharacterized protein PGTG_01721 [Puccinia graminis f. sp. tritici CRL 75-36-700-3]EFP75128.1 hypothetical protein PGTG_01721 [Puccinia graminis f. sp. tritici CRL 75-36-700-3]
MPSPCVKCSQSHPMLRTLICRETIATILAGLHRGYIRNSSFDVQPPVMDCRGKNAFVREPRRGLQINMANHSRRRLLGFGARVKEFQYLRCDDLFDKQWSLEGLWRRNGEQTDFQNRVIAEKECKRRTPESVFLGHAVTGA